jgi:tellurite resistance protein TerC
MHVGWFGWTALVVAVIVMLVIDLVLFGRKSEDNSINARTAMLWSVVWAAVGVAFAGVVWMLDSHVAAQEYLTGFLIEKMLSLDNLFVFAMIFMYFKVPTTLQRRVIFWGIVGAIVLRGIFIFAGAALLDAFHWMVYIFGAFLIYTAFKMLKDDDNDIEPDQTLPMRLLRKVIPVTNEYDGERFFIRRDGVRHATPLVAAFVMVAAFDALFALDSIPAIFAVTRDTFVVASANAMSLLGMTALYFLLVDMMGRFKYLNVGLAIVLAFVGVKMMIVDIYHMPTWISLIVIVVVLGLTIWYSLAKTKEQTAASGGATDGG